MEEHHTPEQVAAAFSVAPKILRELQEIGFTYPHFDIYSDASGRLVLCRREEQLNYTPEQFEKAANLIHSARLDWVRLEYVGDEMKVIETDEISIHFCDGLIQAAGVE